MNETTVSDFTSNIRTLPFFEKNNELELLNSFFFEQLKMHSEQYEEIEEREDSLKITSFTKNIEESSKISSFEQNLVSSTEFELNNRSNSFNSNGKLKDFVFENLGRRRRREEIVQNLNSGLKMEKKFLNLKLKVEPNFHKNQLIVKKAKIYSKEKGNTKLNGTLIASILVFCGLLFHMLGKIRENDPIYQENYRKSEF